MVTFNDDKILVTSILLMKLLRVMLLYEIIVFPSDKKSRNKALISVNDWRDLPNVEASLFLDGALEHSNSHTDHETWYNDPLLSALIN